jgi:hypothetical protein
MAEGTEREEAAEAGGSASKRTRPYEDSVAGRSDVDAMGNDKRRAVIGGQYGASVRKRLVVYGIAVAVVVGLVIVSLTVVSNVDNKDIALKDTAPWTEAEGSLETPRDLDYIRSGPGDKNSIPPEDVVNR